VLGGIAAFFLLRSAPTTAPTASTTPVSPEPTQTQPEPAAPIGEVGSVAPEPPGQTATQRAIAQAAFDGLRKTLLNATGSWEGSAARLWTEPSPVPNDTTYKVRFEAKCDCAVLIFTVAGSGDEISLLYPNPFEPPKRLVVGEMVEIPASDSYSLRAVGGGGLDVLKIFVSDEDFHFPPDPAESWYVTPENAQQVAELTSFLARIEGQHWDSVTTPLQIVK
jgi:hypothetical protein